MLNVNLVGPFRLTKVIAGSMALRGRGLVITISSDAAIEAYSGWGSYGISKAALDHMTRIFAAELHDVGVRFVSIDPGEMDTKMHADAIPMPIAPNWRSLMMLRRGYSKLFGSRKRSKVESGWSFP